MKNTTLIPTAAAIVFLAALFSSCTKTEYIDREVIKNITDTLYIEEGYTIDELNVALPTEGGSATLTFTTTESWNASIINSRADGWLTYSPENGSKGHGKVEIKASSNDSGAERSATLRISSGKGYTDFCIVQKPASSLLATATKYEITREGGEFTVEIKSDVEFDYTLDSDAEEWLSEKTIINDMSDKKMTFIAKANDGERREGRIIFCAGPLKEVVSVYQEGKDMAMEHIILTSKECQLSADGGTVKVEISGKYNVSMRIPDGYDWIKEGNGESTNTFYLEIATNASTDSREGFVSFTDKDGGFSENVSILQLQKDAIVLSKNSYMFGNEGGTLELKALANNPVEVSIDVDWVQRVQQTKAMTESSLCFNIERGYTGEDRTAVITIRSGSAVQTVTIHQFPMNDPIEFACSAVKDRLVALFDANGDGELSYKEAAAVTSLKNVFNEVSETITLGWYTDADGNLQTGQSVSYRCVSKYVKPEEFTSFDEIKFFTGLTEIPPYTFYEFPFLSKIELPDGIREIGLMAFRSREHSVQQAEKYGTGLLSISLPNTLESIGNYAFYNCPLTEGVTLPSSLQKIGTCSFSRCCLYDYEKRDTLSSSGGYLASSGLKSIVIPESVTSIGYGAFSYCKALESVSIQNTVTASGSIFSNCPFLKDLSGSAVGGDGQYLLDRNGHLFDFFDRNLVEYTIPEGVTAAITICPQTLKCLTVPSSFSFGTDSRNSNPFTGYYCLEQFRGPYAAADGYAIIKDNLLVSVVRTLNGTFSIPDNITEAAYGAFYYSQIHKCVLPKGFTTISKGMFSYCENLEDIEGIDSVERIEDYGLQSCTKLLSRFKVPSSVKYLGIYSLYSPNIAIIEFESLTPPSLGKRYYQEDNSVATASKPFGNKTTIYVPDIAYDRYQSSYYGLGAPVHKLSELYKPAEFEIERTDSRIVLRVKGDEDPDHEYVMIKVEAGSFEREVPSTGRWNSGVYEYDKVKVNITKDFYIGQTEFPQWLWTRVVHSNPSAFTELYNSKLENSDLRPVESVTWQDCVDFISELNTLTGLKFRLPTEAEWEYAARGGKESRGYLFSGSDDPSTVAVYSSDNTEPCGIKAPNELGIYDMNGNVWEFCSDYYSSWGNLQSADIPQGDDPTGPETGDVRVKRGGAYNRSASDGFVGTYNNRFFVWNSQDTDGFRLAL